MIDQKLNDSIRRLRIHAQKRLVFQPGIPKREQLSSYKKYLELENLMIKRAHEKNNSGRENCRMRSAMIDVVIENLFLAGLDLYITKFQNIKYKMAVVALGGYGRAELNPHSDIDIMFLYPDVTESTELTEFKKIIAEEVLYPLWD